MRFALFKAWMERLRTREECQYLVHDCVVLYAYYAYQRSVILRFVLAHAGSMSRGLACLLAAKLSEIGRLADQSATAFSTIKAGASSALLSDRVRPRGSE
jgi:hypothetical protein